MKKKGVIFCVVFLLSATVWADKFELSEPLQFQDKTILGILDSKDIESLYDLPVKLSDKDPETQLKLKSVTMKTSKSVKTCREYEKAKKEGYDVDTTFDIAMESFLKKVCVVLDLLKVSKTAANKGV